MGLFSSVLGSTKAFPASEQEAVLGILIAVIAADGEISEDESESFFYLANKTKTLGPMPGPAFKGHVDTCLSILRREGPSALMERSTAHITADRRKPLFINCCDLIMRDGKVEPEEETIIEDLQRRLSLDDSFVQSAVAVILSKYAL